LARNRWRAGGTKAIAAVFREFANIGVREREHRSDDCFSLAGSGSGTVVTPPAFAAGARYTVRLRGDRVD
jgi:hypothetical protein